MNSLAEEIANAVTHGIGAALAVAGLVVLVLLAAQTGSGAALAAALIYGGALVLLYLASTLYHGIPHRPTKAVMLLLDHCAIFVLIAGTYTPFALLAFPPEHGRPLLVAIWSLAGLGIAVKVAAFFLRALERFDGLSVLFYLAMGWLGLGWGADIMFASLSTGALAWLFAGGLLYTAGVAFYRWERLPFNHAVWHLFVLGASACHFASVAGYVLPEA
jgi:hemolysin III